MKVACIFLLCILGAALLSAVLCNNGGASVECCFELYEKCARGPDDCCFDYFLKPVKKDLINSYYKTDPRCPLSAAVLITKKFRRICVDPKQPWVERIINNLEKKSL